MLMNGSNDADFLTMFLNEGIPLERVNIFPSSYNVEDLINRKVDAFNSYLTNEPYFLQQRDIPYHVINPANYRVDFYSDILFTTEAELHDHPGRVEAMRRATLKGWRHAMDHPDEIIDLLIKKYRVEKSRKHLEFEAAEMRKLIFPDLIEIGHMNQMRWHHMADSFVSAGLVQPDYSLEGFIYDTTPRQLPKWVLPLMIAAIVVILVISFITMFLLRVNRRLAITEARLRSTNEDLCSKLDEIGELNLRIQEQSIRDPLTGLYNRRYLDEMLEREISRAKREGYRISLAMMDLDHFKNVNDTYGHQVGDLVLRTLGKLLLEHAREGDIACRYGGEEFVLVLPRLSVEHAYHRAEEWRQAFAGVVTRHGDLEISCTMSVGLAAYPDHSASSDKLISQADKALYKAKLAGRNRTEIAGQS